MTEELTLLCAGRSVANAREQIRRYCGLPWSGGGPEVWAYQYYDTIPTGPDDDPGPPDTLAAAALHPGFGRREMVFFNKEGYRLLKDWLTVLPQDVDLARADHRCVAQVAQLSSVTDGEWLSVLSKVAHHKRPRLVPLFDRAIVDCYRPITGIRGTAAWPALVREIRADLALPDNQRFLSDVREELARELSGPVPSDLRLLDIAVWMEGRK